MAYKSEFKQWQDELSGKRSINWLDVLIICGIVLGAMCFCGAILEWRLAVARN